MPFSSRDTIAATATAPGRGGVAIIRISGSEAFSIAERLSGRVPRAGRISFDQYRIDGRLLDEGVTLAFRGPHSYTGEDVVELQCHGGSVVPRRVLEACLASGARLARRRSRFSISSTRRPTAAQTPRCVGLPAKGGARYAAYTTRLSIFRPRQSMRLT